MSNQVAIKYIRTPIKGTINPKANIFVSASFSKPHFLSRPSCVNTKAGFTIRMRMINKIYNNKATCKRVNSNEIMILVLPL